jgi:hypothetical protein
VRRWFDDRGFGATTAYQYGDIGATKLIARNQIRAIRADLSAEAIHFEIPKKQSNG